MPRLDLARNSEHVSKWSYEEEKCEQNSDDDDNTEKGLEAHLGNYEIDKQGGNDDSESENATYGQNGCPLCEQNFTCLYDLCDHFQKNHEDYYMKTQALVVF